MEKKKKMWEERYGELLRSMIFELLDNARRRDMEGLKKYLAGCFNSAKEILTSDTPSKTNLSLALVYYSFLRYAKDELAQTTTVRQHLWQDVDQKVSEMETLLILSYKKHFWPKDHIYKSISLGFIEGRSIDLFVWLVIPD